MKPDKYEEMNIKRTAYFAEGFLQSLIGIGAVFGGALLIISPDGRYLQMSIDILQNSPFRNFLIPGIILFLVIGVGNVISAALCFKMHKIAGFAGLFFGFGLIIWIFVQVNMIGGGSWLQYLYFLLGIIEILLSIMMREQERKCRPGFKNTLESDGFLNLLLAILTRQKWLYGEKRQLRTAKPKIHEIITSRQASKY